MMRPVAKSVAVLLCVAPMLRAQEQRGTIRGNVKNEYKDRLAGVQVSVLDTDIRARTNADGDYALTGVWHGETRVIARALGYLPETLVVAVRADGTTDADFVLRFVKGDLTPVIVSGDAPASARMASFEQRRARGGGAFITRAEIERRHPEMLSDMLRSVPGLTVSSRTRAGEQAQVIIARSSASLANGTCEIQMYVDGHPYLHGNLDDFPTDAVEGIEIYRGGANLPAEFRAVNAGCGLIAVWTRDPSAMIGKPETPS